MHPIPCLPETRPEDVGLSSARLARIRDALAREVGRGRLPGAVALVARHGRLAWFDSLGVLDPATGAPMGHDAIFRVYSMTKPIVSVAVMMMFEEGRLLLDDPISKYLPEFATQAVAIEHDGRVELVAAARPPTVQDLLRHTSGLGYEFTGESAVQRMYSDASLTDQSQTNAQIVSRLADLPLMHQPGSRWEYGRSTDVLGRMLEVLSGQSLGEHLRSRVLEPLGMADTGFHVPAATHHRIAEPFDIDPDGGGEVRLIGVRQPPALEFGGGGLVSTATDYARFLKMLLDGGELDGARLLGRKTIEFMTSDHLGAIPCSSDILPTGYGFGLGFAVRLQDGIATVPGSAGQYHWGGIAGTTFWVDPRERLFALMMCQAPNQRDEFRPLFRDLVYAAIVD
jgi:CubicO group peptidase (beta-lactamase class C family)